MKKPFVLILPLLLGICTSCNKKVSSETTIAYTAKANNDIKKPQAGIRPEDCYDSMDDLLNWFDALYEPGDEITIKYLPNTKQYCITSYSNVLKNKY